MSKSVLSGNEAIARGAFEAGVLLASAYPGTPSTEILENICRYPEIDSSWHRMRKSPSKSPSVPPSAAPVPSPA